MSARSAKEDAKLGPLIRERQDLVAEWQALDQAHTLAMVRTADKRDAKSEADNAARLKAIDARVSEIDKALAKDFPEYAAFTSTQPLDIPTVQTQLRADEALVLFLDTPERKPTPPTRLVSGSSPSPTRGGCAANLVPRH